MVVNRTMKIISLNDEKMINVLNDFGFRSLKLSEEVQKSLIL